MLAKSAKRKGKDLEKFVASQLKTIFGGFCYSRADSGSGLHHKEDVTVPDWVPLHIECKNQAVLSLKSWWDQTLRGCKHSCYPVLIYRLNYQPEPVVVMKLENFLDFFEVSTPYTQFTDNPNNSVRKLGETLIITLTFTLFREMLRHAYLDDVEHPKGPKMG